MRIVDEAVVLDTTVVLLSEGACCWPKTGNATASKANNSKRMVSPKGASVNGPTSDSSVSR